MDFIFGTLATDELKTVHHRARRLGVQHQHMLHPRDPLPGQPVTITAQIGTDLLADNVACYYTTDGSQPAGARGAATNGHVIRLERVDVAWDTLAWGYVTRWQATLPAQPEGITIRYRIGAWAGDGPETFADWPDVTATAEAAASAFFRQKPVPPDLRRGDPAGHTFAFHVDTFAPPAWARQAVIYHVFVDRFYPGEGRDWLQTTDLMGFCGGTLWGVRDKMDYIAELGATCLWLSPTWPAPSHHGYDVTDFDRVEPRLGGDEALHAVVEAAHARGIRVLLDLVCNHISDQHPIFQAALADPASPYRAWFTFDDSETGYRAFFGNPAMPQVNLAHPDARDWMIGIARRWLRDFRVDGYRLDYANGPGPDFWTDFWTACKGENPDSFCFGEVVNAPDVIETYRGRLDGCLDFHLSEAIRKTYGWRAWSEEQFAVFAARHADYFAGDFVMPVFLDNHDMDRFLFIAGGDKAALRRAAAVQMAQPGPPVILYGTEVGLSQATSTQQGGHHLSRTPMAWGDDQDRDLLRDYQALIRARQSAG